MLKHAFVIAAAAGVAASSAAAGVVSQTVPFDYDPTVGTIELVVEGFDTLGGARALTSVHFEFEHSFSAELFVESTGPTALSAKDFITSTAFISIFQLGTVDDEGGEGASRGDGGPPGPPFFGPGAFFIDNQSGDLAAYDGIPGNDGPDSFRRTFTDAYTWEGTFGAEDPSVLAAVTDVGPLTTIYGGFLEASFFWINDPSWPPPDDFFPVYPDDAAVWVGLQNFRHSGEIRISYEFANVPAPSAALPLAVMALVGRRRRA